MIFIGCLVSFPIKATIYKCTENGKIAFSNEKCEGAGEEVELKIINTIDKHRSSKIEKREKVAVNLLDAGKAISIRSIQCLRPDHSGVVYKGVIENISKFGTYGAKVKVLFKYRKNRKDFRIWDSETKYFELKPKEKRYFEMVSRIAPDSFEMKCSRTATVKFIDSTYKI